MSAAFQLAERLVQALGRIGDLDPTLGQVVALARAVRSEIEMSDKAYEVMRDELHNARASGFRPTAAMAEVEAPRDIALLPDYWDARRLARGKPDKSACAAELRLALQWQQEDGTRARKLAALDSALACDDDAQEGVRVGTLEILDKVDFDADPKGAMRRAGPDHQVIVREGDKTHFAFGGDITTFGAPPEDDT